jgi:hypothetical protein
MDKLRSIIREEIRKLNELASDRLKSAVREHLGDRHVAPFMEALMDRGVAGGAEAYIDDVAESDNYVFYNQAEIKQEILPPAQDYVDAYGF